jgi:hemerythrin-like domain-containing protein
MHDEPSADPASMHPIATLLDEHRTILRVLAEMEQECGRLTGDAPLVPFWQRTLRFLEVFDEQLHHDKEEGLLFPALEAAGLSPQSGPTAVLRSEHGRCRLWRQGIEQAIERNDSLRLLGAVQGFVDLQRQHVLKENQILFPLARQLLSVEVFERMARAFQERDEDAAFELREGRILRAP